MNVAFLCLGGNMSDRLAYINDAKMLINSKCGKIAAESGIYETKAWGIENSADYYNQCIELRTEMDAHQLLKELLKIESDMGRIRTVNKNEARTIDIDILFYNDEVINEGDLQIPHPRMHLRQFVLKPLNEIAADHIHPVLNRTVSQLLKNCTDINSAKKIVNDLTE